MIEAVRYANARVGFHSHYFQPYPSSLLLRKHSVNASQIFFRMFSLQVEASVNNLLSFGLIYVHCYFITAVDSKKSQDIPEKDQETFEKECYFFFYCTFISHK